MRREVCMHSSKRRIPKTITLSVQAHDALDQYCSMHRVAASKLIEQLITNYLRDWLQEYDQKKRG